MAGSGGNGGGVLVAARHLKNWGVNVSVIVAKPGNTFKNISAHQLSILQKMNFPIYLMKAFGLKN